MKAEKKISEVFPSSRVFQLKGGKTATVGLFTLADLVWVEETYGSLEAVLDKAGKGGTVEMCKIIFQLVENKEDFPGGYQEFLRAAPLAVFNPGDVLKWAMDASMPAATAGGKKGN